MIGIVVTAMGGLGAALKQAVEHAIGKHEQFEAIGVYPEDDVEQVRERIKEAVDRVDTGEGVVIVSDMFGGVPSNLSIAQMNRPNVEVLAGASLPMLVKLINARDQDLQSAVATAAEAGKKYLVVASRVLAGSSSRATERKDDVAKEDLKQSLVQRPAAFRFGIRNGKIDSLPESLETLDLGVAEDLRQEVLNKAELFLLQSAQTNSAPRTHHSVDRLREALGKSFADLRPGILLSRARSIEADRIAFDSEEARRELFPEAIARLDDLLLSLQDLLAVFPVVREIEAERVALNIEESANELDRIQQHITAVRVVANESDALTQNAIGALNAHERDIQDARTGTLRTRLVADQLLVVRNFASAVARAVSAYGADALKAAGTGFGHTRTAFKDLGGETWGEIRKNLPLGTGVAARVLPIVLTIALLGAILPPVVGLAALIAGFRPLSKAIQQLLNQRDAEKSNPPPKRRPRSAKK